MTSKLYLLYLPGLGKTRLFSALPFRNAVLPGPAICLQSSIILPVFCSRKNHTRFSFFAILKNCSKVDNLDDRSKMSGNNNNEEALPLSPDCVQRNLFEGNARLSADWLVVLLDFLEIRRR